MGDIVGIDLGGTKIAFGILDTKSETVKDIKCVTTPKTKEQILQLLSDICQNNICGIGIPGQVKEDRIIFTPNLPLTGTTLSEIPFAHSIINDANAFLLGELQNMKKPPEVSIAFTLGTGIGGSIAIRGKILEGPHGTSGEFGHITMIMDGPMCGCGNRGCAEALASPKSIERWAWEEIKHGGNSKIQVPTFPNLLKLFPEEPLATRAIVRFAEYIGTLAASVANALDPEVIFFGGSAVKSWNIWYPIAKSVFERRVLPSIKGKVSWIASKNPEKSAILGAALSAIREWRL